MKESMWGSYIIGFGVIAIIFIFFFQNVSNTSEQDYELIQEITEAAMYDAVDMASYKTTGNIRIDGEKFAENFVRRFAQSVSLGNYYVIDIYDIQESPPKVVLRISTKLDTNVIGEFVEFDIINDINAILETPY